MIWKFSELRINGLLRNKRESGNTTDFSGIYDSHIQSKQQVIVPTFDNTQYDREGDELDIYIYKAAGC